VRGRLTRTGFRIGGTLVAALALVAPARAQTIRELQQMSIDQLKDIDVTSVTGTSEALSSAPAAVYVITHEAIARSGAVTLPEILRLAPNLQVKQISASRYIITARGFSGNLDAQNFANKLLVLIDGRSVYTPLYSGVYWDMQDVVPADIERIEVISGPGSTLWGANAVNGVINIVTRTSRDTQGGLLDVALGNLEQSATLRYGGRINDALTYKAYIRDTIGNNTTTATGATADDHWQRPQGGFRLDWERSEADAVSLQGDLYNGSLAQAGAPNEYIRGDNLLTRWNHNWSDGSTLQVIAYYDHTNRGNTVNGAGFWLDTYDIDAQHSFDLNEDNTVTWGGGYRSSHYLIAGTPSLFFVPPRRTLTLANGFVQDRIALSPQVSAILGFKAEDDPYSGLAILPSVRLSWNPSDAFLLWGAASRAIRSPTPFDSDVQERFGTIVALGGDPAFRSETLTAYEIGTRGQLNEQISFSVSGFYNFYSNLRNIEIISGPAFLNLQWGNGLRGHTYGFGVWGQYQFLPWWRLSASFNELIENFSFKPGATTILGAAQLGDDPEQTASLRSSMNLGDAVTLDLDLRYVSALPAPRVPSYVELGASIGWNVSDELRLSLSGYNLLHPRHQEFPATQANAVPRSFAAELQWRF
jgi:iron complex outermembrane receptor protein